tara:strand:- start:111 stop:458 length:348 start_codon:yes stop_codon:yes gene_type:complete
MTARARDDSLPVTETAVEAEVWAAAPGTETFCVSIIKICTDIHFADKYYLLFLFNISRSLSGSGAIPVSIAESDRHASLRSDGASASTPKAGAGAGAEAGAGAGASGVDAGMPMF